MPYAFNEKKEKVEVLPASESATKGDISELQSQLNSLNLDGRYYTKSQMDYKLKQKQDLVSGAASTIVNQDLPRNTVPIANNYGKIVASNITSSQLNQLSGVTGNIQTQLNGKMPNNPQSIELYFTTPFIDFHKGSTSTDYSARIIQMEDDFLEFKSSGTRWCGLKARAIHAYGYGTTKLPSLTFHYNENASATSEIEAKGNDRVDVVASNGGTTNSKIYAGSFVQYSSMHLKENIKSMTKTEAKKILKLNPVSFDYIEGVKDQRGLIAEEVQKIYPQMVQLPYEGFTEFNEEEPWNALSIDYARLVPALIKMIQIQQEEIDGLKKNIE